MKSNNTSADSPEVVALKAELAAVKALNARLETKGNLGQVTYEPVTPHGAAARAMSAYNHMTVREVEAAIDRGEIREPETSYLCADGYFCRRHSS